MKTKSLYKQYSDAGAVAVVSLFFIGSPVMQHNSNAQFDAGAIALTGAAGAAGLALGNQWADQWQAAPYVAAGVLPALVNWGYSIFKNKNDEDKIKYYISGRNYERWIRSQETWYISTLDPYTGRPQAFSGLNAMDDGMPASEMGSQQSSQGINHLYTVPVKMPAGTYGGVPYTERVTEFPKLP
jgi:hypothetical protein